MGNPGRWFLEGERKRKEAAKKYQTAGVASNQNKNTKSSKKNNLSKASTARFGGYNSAKSGKSNTPANPLDYLYNTFKRASKPDNSRLSKNIGSNRFGTYNRDRGIENSANKRANNFMDSKLNQYVGEPIKFLSGSAANFWKNGGGRNNRYSSVLKTSAEQAEETEKLADERIARSRAKMQEAKSGLGNFGKDALDVTSVIMDIGADALAGLGTGGLGGVAGRFNRIAGGSMYDAEQEGANKNDAVKYGIGSGALESLTEMLGGNVAKPIAKAYGKGITDDALESMFLKVASKGKTKKGKDALYNTAKSILTAGTEGAEEALSEILNPSLKNMTYSEGEKVNPEDVLQSFKIGAITGGVLGGAGQIADHTQKKNYAKQSGLEEPENLGALISEGLASDETTAANKIARQLKDTIDSGREVTPTEIVAQQKANAEAIQAETYAYEKQKGIAEKAASEQGLAPIMLDHGNGEMIVGGATAQRLKDTTSRVSQKLVATQAVDEGSAMDTAASISRIMVGMGDGTDFTALLPTIENEPARQVYMEETGTMLPDTNEGTRTVLSQANMENMLMMRREETAFQAEQQKADIIKEAETSFGKEGAAIFANAIQESDGDYGTVMQEFKNYYDGGTVNYPAAQIDAALGQSALSYPMKMAAWNAGFKNTESRRQADMTSSKNDINSKKKYSIQYTTENRPVVTIDRDITKGKPANEWQKVAREELKKFKSIPIPNNIIFLNKDGRKEMTKGRDLYSYKNDKMKIFEDKLKTMANVDEVVWASTDYVNEEPAHARKDAIVDFARGKVNLRIGENDYLADVIIGNTKENKLVLYDITKFTPTTFTLKNNRRSENHVLNEAKPHNASTTSVNNSIPNLKKDGNPKNTGTFKSYVAPAVVPKEKQNGLRQLAKGLNVNIELHPILEHDANGYYKDGTIHLSAKTDNPMMSVFKHELTHHIQETAPAEYQKLKDFVMQEYYKGDKQAFQRAIDEKVQAYAKQGAELTRDQAMDEIIANSTEKFLTDEAAIEKVVKQDHSLGQTILDAIRKMIDSIKGLLADAKNVDRGYSKFLEDLGILERAEKLWVDALKVSVKNNDATREKMTRFDIKNFEITKDQVFENMKVVTSMDNVATLKGDEIKGKPKEVIDAATTYFNEIGNSVHNVDLGDITLSRRGAKATVNHGKVYDNKSSAIAALKEVLTNGKIIDAQRNWKGKDFDTVVLAAPVEIAKKDNYMAVVLKRRINEKKPKSSYQSFYVHAIGWADTKKQSSRPFAIATESGNPETSSGSTTAIDSLLDMLVEVNSLKNHKGSQATDIEASIKSKIVSHEGKFSLKDSNGRQLTDQQAEFFKDSRFRDNDGNLLPMYHGTAEEFWTFDHKKAQDLAGRKMGLGAGKGKFYFTQHKAVADVAAQSSESMGKGNKVNVKEVYLNATKVMDRSEYQKLLESEYEKVPEANPKSEYYDYQERDRAIERVDKRIKRQGYNGVFDRESGEAFVFTSNQVKAVTNENPTNDPDIRYSLKEDETLNSFGIKKLNDYIHVQKQVLSTLTNEGFFGDTGSLQVKVESTGAIIDIGRKGIRETLGIGNRFATLPRELKLYKLATIRKLPEIISVSELETEDVKNYHGEGKKSTFDYFRASVVINQNPCTVRIAVKKSQVKNKFWMHMIEIENGQGLNLPHNNEGHNEFPAHGDSLTQEVDMRNKKKYSLKDHPDEQALIDYVNAGIETKFTDMPPIRDYDKKAKIVRMKSVEELTRQVEQLQQETKLTHGKMPDQRDLINQSTNLVRTLMAGKVKKNLVDMAANNASQMFTQIKRGHEEDAIIQAYNTARELVENLDLVDDAMYTEYKSLRDYLRKTPIKVSDNDKPADYEDFRRSQLGRLKLTSKDGLPVDTIYEELKELYPALFSEDIINPADQLQEIADVRESLEPYDVMLSDEETEQLIKETASSLLEIAYNGKPRQTFADKKKAFFDAKVKRLKEEQKEAKDKIRKQYQGIVKKHDEKARQRRIEDKRKARNKAEKKRSVGNIEKNVDWLSDRLLKPTDDKHLPHGFSKAVADLLQCFDLQTDRSKALEVKFGKAKKTLNFESLMRQYQKIAKEDGSGEVEYDGYVFDMMDALAEKLEGKTIDQASNQDLKDIDTLLKAVVGNFKNMNKAFTDGVKATISDMGDAAITEFQRRTAQRKGKGKSENLIDRLLNESMVTPRDFFELMGGNMETLYGNIRKGFDDHVRNIAHTREFFEELFQKYNKKKKPGSKIQVWSDAKSQVEFKLQQGGTIKLNPAQIMTLYCLNKREQAQGHIYASGIVASEVSEGKKLKQRLRGERSNTSKTSFVTVEDMQTILGMLTEEQIQIAEKLMGYLNTECTKWGNETSLRMNNYEKFTEDNYFPIISAKEYLDVDFSKRSNNIVETIKNASFTKSTAINANNPIMVADIFEVVTDHINKMSMYNAFAAPIADFQRVYNYKQRDESGLQTTSVQAEMREACGQKALEYIKNLMADLNNFGNLRREPFEALLNKGLTAYKKAAIGFNFRVAIQQPTAIARAFVHINPIYFVNGKINLRKNLQEMKEHCPIAMWKSWGFSQTDVARDMKDIIMNDNWTKLDLVSMMPYGALDNATWATIWAAVKTETEAKHKDVKVGSDQFWKICSERAAYIYDKTQVVDSPLHRSQVMRNPNVGLKMLTSFMAEPTRTFNMCRTEALKGIQNIKDGNLAKGIGEISKVSTVFLLNAALVSAAAAVADAIREKLPGGDDDDEEERSRAEYWLINFWANLGDNLNPLNMIPVLKEYGSIKDGWGTSNMALEGAEAIITAATNWQKYMNGETDKTPAELMRKSAEAVGMVTGVPIKNIIREFESWTKLLGLEAHAATEGADTGEKSLLDKFRAWISSSKGKNKKKGGKSKDADAWTYDERLEDVEEAMKGLSGKEKQDMIWKTATKNYTKYIEQGRMISIGEIETILKETGGDYEKFREKVTNEVKSEFKKCIGSDTDRIEKYRQYLYEAGYTDVKISQDVIAKSETAKEFKKACALQEDDTAVETLQALRDAGITYEDAYALYLKRSNSIKSTDYSSGELAWPIDGNSRISSYYGRRSSPGGIGSTNHQGIDIAASAGTNVMAADGGKVSYTGYNRSRGYYVDVDHGNGRKTRYQHLQGYTVLKGDVVKKGDLIAYVGSTGNSTGPHLHIEVLEGGQTVDPMIYFH